ncbi:MAG: hypothetical protein ABSH05_09380 [Bryobacteraceae bacterium]|jgi:hypothetical protein
MRVRFALLLLGLCFWLPAQTKVTVDKLVGMIRSSIQLKHSDKEVANYVRKLALSQRLDDRTIEELQGLGAGPKTVEALNALRDASKDLPAPPPVVVAPETPAPAPFPPPSPAEQRRVIDQAREFALGYTKNLPNYICTQVTRRYVDPSGLEYWQQRDVLTARLSFFEQKENYKLVLVNNRAITTDVPYQSVGGSISTGEFGSMLKEMFEPEAKADFRWERWGKLRGRVAHVYAYRVEKARSKWHVTYESTDDIVPGYHGLVYIDPATDMVLRIVFEAELPGDFPIQQVTDTLDYDLAPIGTQEFMLPLKAVMRMRQAKLLTKNDVEFRLYRKFTAEAEIKYDTPEPLPEDKTKEQPPH